MTLYIALAPLIVPGMTAWTLKFIKERAEFTGSPIHQFRLISYTAYTLHLSNRLRVNFWLNPYVPPLSATRLSGGSSKWRATSPSFWLELG